MGDRHFLKICSSTQTAILSVASLLCSPEIFLSRVRSFTTTIANQPRPSRPHRIVRLLCGSLLVWHDACCALDARGLARCRSAGPRLDRAAGHRAPAPPLVPDPRRVWHVVGSRATAPQAPGRRVREPGLLRERRATSVQRHGPRARRSHRQPGRIAQWPVRRLHASRLVRVAQPELDHAVGLVHLVGRHGAADALRLRRCATEFSIELSDISITDEIFCSLPLIRSLAVLSE